MALFLGGIFINKSLFIKKMIYALLTIVIVVIFNYFLFRILPGDPLSMIIRNSKATPEMIENIKKFYGLNLSPMEQFVIYFKNLLKGDLGFSFVYKAPVKDVIGSVILPTVILVGLAELIAIVVGIFFGVLSAWKRGTKLDLGTLSFSLVTYAMPTFWLGMIMVAVFSLNLRMFPTGNMFTPGREFASIGSMMADLSRHLFLPVVTLSLVLIGQYALTMRNTLSDVLSEDFITTAKAKGFRQKYILSKHAMPNAMLPMVTIIAINLGLIVAGTIQIETIFSWPGLGNLMYEALKSRDYPLLQGIFLLVTICVVVANFLADLTYSYLDPRVKN